MPPTTSIPLGFVMHFPARHKPESSYISKQFLYCVFRVWVSCLPCEVFRSLWVVVSEAGCKVAGASDGPLAIAIAAIRFPTPQ